MYGSFAFQYGRKHSDSLFGKGKRINSFIAKLIRKAKKRIVVIDSYVDDSVLVQLSKRNPGVTVDIYDGKISQQLRQDVALLTVAVCDCILQFKVLKQVQSLSEHPSLRTQTASFQGL